MHIASRNIDAASQRVQDGMRSRGLRRIGVLLQPVQVKYANGR